MWDHATVVKVFRHTRVYILSLEKVGTSPCLKASVSVDHDTLRTPKLGFMTGSFGYSRLKTGSRSPVHGTVFICLKGGETFHRPD